MVKDIFPRTPAAVLNRDFSQSDLQKTFRTELVAALTGTTVPFIKRALGSKAPTLKLREVLMLLEQDAFRETFVPRSRVPGFLLRRIDEDQRRLGMPDSYALICGSAKDLIPQLPRESVQCVVTSTPYWGTRLYDQHFAVQWADGENCPLGNEQTPEGFIRHTIELLFLLKPALKRASSVWWNLMDTYNTRTQIRRNAAETLRAMKGNDPRGWLDHDCRRYSAGHSFLKDGEQCLIPFRVAEGAARIGYYVKSFITWKKNGSMPETVNSRVTRELEYVIHLSVDRTPLFRKGQYSAIPIDIGGRNRSFESEKLTDVWCFRTSLGKEGHGAQFPLELPGRCIALSTRENDVVLDPFVGAGTSILAALKLKRRALGFDVSSKYLRIAERKLTTLNTESHSEEDYSLALPLAFEEIPGQGL